MKTIYSDDQRLHFPKFEVLDGELVTPFESPQPISQFKLEGEHYLRMGEAISRLNKPTVFVMKGGYAGEEIGVNVVSVLQGFESV